MAAPIHEIGKSTSGSLVADSSLKAVEFTCGGYSRTIHKHGNPTRYREVSWFSRSPHSDLVFIAMNMIHENRDDLGGTSVHGAG